MILEEDQNNVEALFNIGNTMSKLEHYKEAIPFFVKVLNIEPDKQISKLKLEHALLQTTFYDYGFLDGTLEISVKNSRGDLVAYLLTTEIKAIKHQIIEDLVDSWPTAKMISQNTKDFAVHQQDFITVVEHDTIFGFHEIPLSEMVDFPLATTWHNQIPVERGDVVTYVYSIFRPV